MVLLINSCCLGLCGNILLLVMILLWTYAYFQSAISVLEKVTFNHLLCGVLYGKTTFLLLLLLIYFDSIVVYFFDVVAILDLIVNKLLLLLLLQLLLYISIFEYFQIPNLLRLLVLTLIIIITFIQDLLLLLPFSSSSYKYLTTVNTAFETILSLLWSWRQTFR
jgi:hypothetical protein